MTERPSSCPRPSETVGSARAAARHLIPGEQGRVVRNFGKQMLRQHLSAGCWPRMTRASPGPWGLLEGQPDRRAMIAFLSHEERREACRSHACSGAWFTVRRWAVWVSVCARLPPCGVGCILGPRDVYYMTYWISEHVFSEATPSTLSPPGPWGGRSTTPLGPTLPSLVTARECRSYCDLLYMCTSILLKPPLFVAEPH